MSFLRNLFSRRSDGGTDVLPPPQPERVSIPSPAPVFTPPKPEPPAPKVAREDCVELPLKAITDLFPAELKVALRKQPSEHVHAQIPRDLIRPQLASGAVRITFAQLRAGTPEIFFHPDGVPAETKVQLPLEAIVPQMMPARREDQRLPDIPVSIPAIFQKSGPPNAVAAKAKADPWYSQRRPAYEATPEPTAATPEPAPAPAAAPIPAPEPAPLKMPPHPLLVSTTLRPRREDPIPQPTPAPDLSQPIAASPDSSRHSTATPEHVAIPLADVLTALPQEVRHAINGSEVQTAVFAIPFGEIDARLRTGKAVFKWAQLRDWCNLPLTAFVDPASEITLPLPAIAPLFLAARRIDDSRKQVTVDDRVPDVFAKANPATTTHQPSPQPQPAPPAAAPAPTPAPAQSPAPPSIPASASAPTSSPFEIIERLRSLPGVIGAFIATCDGLLVAGEVPDGNENALAAFAPTAFAQLTKYAGMARLGVPDTIEVQSAGGVIVRIRKTSKLYVGLLASAGQPLPLEDFSTISSALQ